MRHFGLDRFVAFNIPDHSEVINNVTNPWWRAYHQIFNEDFDLTQLESFIKKTFLSTSMFTPNNRDNVVGIHIRFGDYVNSPISNCFDKLKYVDKCLSTI